MHILMLSMAMLYSVINEEGGGTNDLSTSYNSPN